MFKSVFSYFLFLFLAGCATQAQLETVRIAKLASATLEKNKACLSEIENKPQYARVYEKLGMGLTTDLNRMPTEEQMNDKERVTDADIALGLSWYAETQDCSLPAIEALSSVDPEYQIFFAKYQNESADLVTEIVKTKPSFGYINQHLMVMKLKTKEEATRLAQHVKARLIAQHQEEIAEATDNVIEVLDLIAALSSKQARLAKAQQGFRSKGGHLRAIRVIKCNPSSGRTYSCSTT